MLKNFIIIKIKYKIKYMLLELLSSHSKKKFIILAIINDFIINEIILLIR